MGFSSIKDYVDSELSGKHTISSFRKVSSAPGGAGAWIDFSVYSGNPKPNYYASTPLESATLNGNYGIYHGQDVDTSKYLKQITIPLAHGTPPNVWVLCDYLMYYPFIDGDETSEQELINSITLPRYEDAIGVRAFIVSQSSYVGGQSYSINYTNSDGVSGRISPTVVMNSTLTAAGVLPIAVTNTNCFLPLAAGDKGVKSIQSITMTSPNGGLHALVLARPLASISSFTASTSSEKCFLLDQASMPEIKNGAYLSFLIFMAGNPGANSNLFGSIETVWGDN